MSSATTFLITRSLANTMKRRMRRLKEPRYLIGALFGIVYLVSLGMRPHLGRRPPRDVVDPTLDAMAGLGVFAAMLINLVFGSSETIRFNQAEVDFLFTAPLTRRQVVNYKLAAVQPALIVSAMLSLFVGIRSVSGSDVLTRVVGLWIVYATLHLHFTAVAFARRSLAEHGLTGAGRRLFFLAIAVIIVATVGVSAWKAVPHFLEAVTAGGDIREAVFGQAFRSPAMTVLMWAPRALVAPAIARTFTDFASRLPAALLVFGLHYVWVISSDASFEEIAAEAAQKRADRARVAGSGARAARFETPTARAFFRLSPQGSPVTAMAWKNLAAFVRLGVSLRFILVGLAMVVTAVVTSTTGHSHSPASVVTGSLLFMFAGFVAFFGPLLLRFDLRRDLAMLDVLKVYPLRGAEIVAGELLAPLCVLGAATCTFLTAGYVTVMTGTPADVPVPTLPLFMSVLVVTIPILLILLIIQNAGALVFPAWAAIGPDRASGFEVLGQRLVWMFGTILGASLMLVPAGLAGACVFFLMNRLVGDVAWFPAATAAGVILLAEASAAILWLGRLFERLDPSTAGIT